MADDTDTEKETKMTEGFDSGMLAGVLASCCDTNLNVERTGNRIVDVLKDQNFQRASQFSAQTQLITEQFNAQNQYLADQFCQIKMREDQREIQALRDKVAEQRDQANTQAILTAIENRTTTTAS